MSKSPTIGIFPAAGGLGTATLETLLTLADPSHVTLISRHPEKLEQEKQQGATLRQADYDDAATLEHAFDGIDVLNLISYASFQVEHRFKVHKLAIDAAIRSGVKTIVYSSLAFAKENDTFSETTVMQAHLQTEAYLRSIHSSDPSFTYLIVRQGLYHESATSMYLAHLDVKQPPKAILIPHDGKAPGVAWAKRVELGEATAKIIHQYTKDPTGLKNTTILLSGPEVLSLQETADIVGKILGVELPIRQVPVEEYVQVDTVKAALGDTATPWANAWEGIRKGETAVLTPDLEKWLGRKPESFEMTMREILKQ